MTPQDAGEGGTAPGRAVPQGDDRRLRVVEGEASSSGARVPDRPSGNLPVALSTFIGREREVAELRRLVEDTRLLTLTGPGGSGKTRLALAVAREVVGRFEDGAWWVELAPLSDPELVPQAVGSARGLREAPGRTLSEAIVEDLQAKDLLLILDNCEHLIDACAALADALLGSCPNLKILATSREALGITGERTYVVPPLSSPDPGGLPPLEELGRYGAVGLFLERAGAANSAFGLTAENAPVAARLCRRLEGVPLAIELAAARTRALSVGQILERLENPLRVLSGTDRTAPERQRTLRGALDWSHELLGEQERRLFGRLSVFAGGWTLEAAEAVGSGDAIEEEDVLDVLSALVDKSLVVAETGPEGASRYRMLEPVRQYAREKLESDGEADTVRLRHASFFLALAKGAESELMGTRQGAWLGRLEREHDNLRAALGWALERDEAKMALDLSGTLGEFWYVRGHWSEGRRWLEMALAGGKEAPGAVRAKSLARTGLMAWGQGDYESSIALTEAGLELSRKTGDDAAVAGALRTLGLAEMHRGQLERATELLEEAVELERASGNGAGVARSLSVLGLVAVARQDYERALALYEEGVALARGTQDDFAVNVSLTTGAFAHLGRGEHRRVMELCEEGFELSGRLRMTLQSAIYLQVSALLAGAQGQALRLARLWGASEALRDAIGSHLTPAETSVYEPYIAAARAQVDEASWEAAWSEGRQMTSDEAIEYALKTEEPSVTPKETAGLSARELEVLRLVAEGLTDSQVAERLYLSPRTVGYHLRSIYRKLGVPSRAAAAKAAVERSLI
jgi:predicted ATPase/DNA-binding CsgD family transcriptional regulator